MLPQRISIIGVEITVCQGESSVLSLTPPPTPASAAAGRRALPLPVPLGRPDTGANRCARRPATGPAPCPLFAGCEGEHARGDLLRVRHRCDRAECLARFPWLPKRGWSARHRAATRAAWEAADRSYSSLAAAASCRLRVP